MDLFFAPLACSMATRIALYEADGETGFVQVDTREKRLEDGSNFLAVNPLGQVPVLRTDDGRLLTENSAILQFVARRYPAAGLLGREEDLSWLQQWLSFVSTELHKAVYAALLDPKAPPAAKEAARDRAASRFDVLERHLASREYLLEGFTVADAYLATVLNWSRYAGLDLGRWPALNAYLERMQARPSVARALREEGALYAAEQQKRAA